MRKWPLYSVAYVSHFNKQQNQGQLFSQFLSKCSFPRDQINSRAQKHVEVFKYHKIFLGKTILWPWELNTFEANLTKLQNWPV